MDLRLEIGTFVVKTLRQSDTSAGRQVERYVDSSSEDDELETPPFFRNR